MTNKRKRGYLLLSLIMALTIFTGCTGYTPKGPEVKVIQGASVNFLDVGQGDCTFIRLPDGKNMLIDTGKDIDSVKDKLDSYFSAYKVKEIDYFVLTHLDDDHVGLANYVLENFKVKKAFVPLVLSDIMPLYPQFEVSLSLMESGGTEVEISDNQDCIKGENYFIAFLSPEPSDSVNGSYSYFNNLSPTDREKNDVSPIIYLNVYGVRFLFMGDASSLEEEKLLHNVGTDLYKNHYGEGYTVDLLQLDYLKVGHHGSRDSTCNDFLSYIKPKTAIISVGGNNYYGHPSTEVLERFLLSAPDCSIFRTDVDGTISVKLYDNGHSKLILDGAQ